MEDHTYFFASSSGPGKRAQVLPLLPPGGHFRVSDRVSNRSRQYASVDNVIAQSGLFYYLMDYSETELYFE